MFQLHTGLYLRFQIIIHLILFFLIILAWHQLDLWILILLVMFSGFFVFKPSFYAIEFQNGQCYFYFKCFVLHVDIQSVYFFKWGWLIRTSQKRYWIFSDALSRENMHEFLWKLDQTMRR